MYDQCVIPLGKKGIFLSETLETHSTLCDKRRAHFMLLQVL